MNLERVRKFLLVALSSGQAGEAHAAMTMAVRELAKGKRDIHWLAEQLTGKGNGRASYPDSVELDRLRRANAALQRENDALRIEVMLARVERGEARRREAPRRERAPPGGGWFDEGAARAHKPAEDPGVDATWQEQLEFCRHPAHAAHLKPREAEFLQSLAAQASMGFHEGAPSFKQLSWLEDIFLRVRRVRASGI